MARWWCVASVEPVDLQRLLAGSLTGLLLFAALDPTLGLRSRAGQFAWLAGTLVAAVATAVLWRRRPAAARSRRLLAIDASAGLWLSGARSDEVRAQAACAGSWRLGPWQFVRLRLAADASVLTLAFDRRRSAPDDWAALQRALVRSRRRPAMSMHYAVPDRTEP